MESADKMHTARSYILVFTIVVILFAGFAFLLLRGDPLRDFRAFLEEHLACAQAEDIEGFLDTYHAESPDRDEAATLFEPVWENYDLKYGYENLSLLSISDVTAEIQVDIVTTRLSGKTFADNRTRQILKLTKDGERWKFYSGEIVDTEFL